jgi:phage gp36-like protein
MAYASAADLLERYPAQEILELTDREGTGDIDYPRVERALADASGAVDEALRAAGYALPLARVPAGVIEQTCLLARCRLYDVTMPEHVRHLCKEASGWLDRVASRRLVLDSEDGRPSGAFVAAAPRTLIYDDAWAERYSL